MFALTVFAIEIFPLKTFKNFTFEAEGNGSLVFKIANWMKLNYLNKLYKYLEIQLIFVLQMYCAGKLDKEIGFRNMT